MFVSQEHCAEACRYAYLVQYSMIRADPSTNFRSCSSFGKVSYCLLLTCTDRQILPTTFNRCRRG